MITTLLGLGAVALKWFGGGAGILGLLSGVLRIPFVSAMVSAIPIVGPVISELAKVFLGWLDALVRFIARACLALLEAVSGRPLIAVPILLAMWGQQLYFEHWKFRHWTPPATSSVSAPASSPSWRTNFRRWLAGRVAPKEAPLPAQSELPNLFDESEAPARSKRRVSKQSRPSEPFDWIERNFRF